MPHSLRNTVADTPPGEDMDWTALFNSLPGQTIYAMIGLAFLDFVLGCLAAFRDKTFKLDSAAAFLRSSGTKVAAAALLIIGGTALHQDLILAAGYAAAAIYTAATVGSLIASWGPKNVNVLGAQRDEA